MPDKKATDALRRLEAGPVKESTHGEPEVVVGKQVTGRGIAPDHFQGIERGRREAAQGQKGAVGGADGRADNEFGPQTNFEQGAEGAYLQGAFCTPTAKDKGFQCISFSLAYSLPLSGQMLRHPVYWSDITVSWQSPLISLGPLDSGYIDAVPLEGEPGQGAVPA